MVTDPPCNVDAPSGVIEYSRINGYAMNADKITAGPGDWFPCPVFALALGLGA